MEQIADQIRAALAPGASPETRAAGAAACRAVLAALEPTPGDSTPGAQALLAQLGRVPAAQRLDVALDIAVAKLRSMLPPDAASINVRSIHFPLVPLGAHVPPGSGR